MNDDDMVKYKNCLTNLREHLHVCHGVDNCRNCDNYLPDNIFEECSSKLNGVKL